MRRWFVDGWGVRPWVIIAGAVIALAGVLVAVREVVVADQRSCIDWCVHAHVEETRDRCVFRCGWGRFQ